jgi:hypothetical protein
LFYSFEDSSIFNVNSEMDLYWLHLLYLPTINSHLQQFRQTYINHKMRTVGYQTPLQIWVRGQFHDTTEDIDENVSLNIIIN